MGGGGTIAARDVAAGRSHTCAVRANGTVACWGSNGAGQLGDGTTTNRLSPVPVAGLTDPVVAIAAGEAHTCVVVATGTARCWGDNSSGQLGDGTTTNRLTPVLVQGVGNAIGIATGGALGSSHSCAVIADGTARCWGANGSGQLGTGDATPSLVAVRVSGLTRAVDIAVGEFHSCALTANGLPFCWGFNGRGQVGNPNLGNHFVPIFVGLDNVVTLAGGNSHTCGLRTDGTQWCWGGNLLGQLGSNSPDPQPLPTLVGTSSPFQAVGIAGGFGHSCAVVSDGSARCWGDNGSGQLGNSTVPSSIEPVPVGRLIGNLATFFSRTTGVVSVTTGRRHSCTLQVSGGVSCWGDNTFGQVGINSTATSQVSPAGVPSFTLNIDPKVVLESNQQVSTVTILANCRGGRQLHVDVTLTQGDVTGHGAATGSCSGGLRRYPVRVSTQALNGYSAGAAQVSADALIRASGKVVDSQQWTRAVQISSELNPASLPAAADAMLCCSRFCGSVPWRRAVRDRGSTPAPQRSTGPGPPDRGQQTCVEPESLDQAATRHGNIEQVTLGASFEVKASERWSDDRSAIALCALAIFIDRSFCDAFAPDAVRNEPEPGGPAQSIAILRRHAMVRSSLDLDRRQTADPLLERFRVRRVRIGDFVKASPVSLRNTAMTAARMLPGFPTGY